MELINAIRGAIESFIQVIKDLVKSMRNLGE